MLGISALVRYFKEAFGDPDIPGSGSAFKIIRMSPSKRKDVLETYRDYRMTGGPPIQAWESELTNAER